MTNIAKARIRVPKGVTLSLHGWKLKAKGKHGELSILLPPYSFLSRDYAYLDFKAHNLSSALYGTLLRKIQALLVGLVSEYRVDLNFVGVGYRAAIENNYFVFRLGYSHNIKHELDLNLKLRLVKRSLIRIKGINYEELNSYAYKLRSYRRPEPFKGKGIIFNGESLRRKEGKKKKI